LSNEITAPESARSTVPQSAAVQPTSNRGPVSEGSTFEGAKQRREIAAIVIDAKNCIAMSNAAGLHHLRLLAPQGAVGKGRPLPDQVVRLVNGLRDDLRRSGPKNSSLLTLPTGLCMRASLLDSAPEQYVLLLVEPFLRLDERNLSRRELEVATLVLNGLSNREIAERLVVAHHTVEGHLKRIFAKTQVRTRAGLVARMLGWQPEEYASAGSSTPAIQAAGQESGGGESPERSPDETGSDVD
jgi:DNA-binding CsgD family transcriptional regulator